MTSRRSFLSPSKSAPSWWPKSVLLRIMLTVVLLWLSLVLLQVIIGVLGLSSGRA